MRDALEDAGALLVVVLEGAQMLHGLLDGGILVPELQLLGVADLFPLLANAFEQRLDLYRRDCRGHFIRPLRGREHVAIRIQHLSWVDMNEGFQLKQDVCERNPGFLGCDLDDVSLDLSNS